MSGVKHSREFTSRQLTTIMLVLVKEHVHLKNDLKTMDALHPVYSSTVRRIDDVEDALLAIEPQMEGGENGRNTNRSNDSGTVRAASHSSTDD